MSNEEEKKRDEEEFADHEVKKEEKKDELSLAKEALEKEKEESTKWKNEYYRAYADLANLRKSLEKDHQEAIKYRSEGFLDGLIPVLDNFYIALEGQVNGEEAKNYRVGFSYIYNQLVNVLTSEGVKEANVKVGDEFNPQYMHAIDTVESEDSENKVAAIHQKGYYLFDRLVRPAMVSVTKKPEKKEESKDSKEKDNEASKA